MSEEVIVLKGLETPPTEPDRDTGVSAIRAMIADPDKPIAEVSRAIALEIASVMSATMDAAPGNRGQHSMTDMGHQVKALRELQKTLTESEILSKKDTLNLEGPKFKYVLQQLLMWFQLSMKDAALHEEMSKNVMRHFSDRIKANEDTLRRDLTKL